MKDSKGMNQPGGELKVLPYEAPVTSSKAVEKLRDGTSATCGVCLLTSGIELKRAKDELAQRLQEKEQLTNDLRLLKQK